VADAAGLVPAALAVGAVGGGAALWIAARVPETLKRAPQRVG